MPISVSPSVVQPTGGKLPSSALVSVSVVGCNDNSGLDLATGGYTLGMTGVGLTFSTPSFSKCFMTSNLTFAPGAAPGTFSVVLFDGKKPVGKTEFGILDTTASPIPSGLAPQVDASFGVVGQKICSDTFGKRVADSLYCVSIRIGNNSGHPLQIAGVGFATRLKSLPGAPVVTLANNTYASTRAVLLRESVLSGRNILYNSLQAAGLLMSSFTPYFVNPTRKSHFAVAGAIVGGAALEAFNIVAPDRVVGQLNNLDDQSFRDNQIIPNNYQIVTTVFVEKRALGEALADLMIQLQSASTMKAAQGQLDVDAQRMSSEDYKNTKALLSTLNDSASATVRNSQRPVFHKGTFSPLLVKLALGSVVIVGDQIEYLQRVQVQGNASQPGPPSGVAVTISPTAQSVVVGATQQFVATVTGSTNTAVAWSVNGIAGGNATLGTVSSAGLYTAPAVIPTQNPVTVKATSTADPSQFSSATVTVTASPITVAISPTSANVAKTGTQQFTAAVAGSTNTGVAWSVNGVVGGNSAVGTITSGGLYTAPSSVPNPSTVTVTATSAAAVTQSSSATVAIH
ncbi:MAG TPA: hypothetical protein VGF05_14725 [Bryobacteraceae bacterium]